jgi:hypothetical protein
VQSAAGPRRGIAPDRRRIDRDALADSHRWKMRFPPACTLAAELHKWQSSA